MNDDTYLLDEDNYRYVGRRTGKIYTLGDSVFIIVKKADLLKKQLDFGFVDGDGMTKEEYNNRPKKHKRKR